MKQLTSIQTNPFNLSVSACDEALQSSESIAYQKAQEGRSPQPGSPGDEINKLLVLKRCTETRQQGLAGLLAAILFSLMFIVMPAAVKNSLMAQSPSAGPELPLKWDLQRCIDHALEHNLHIKQQLMQEERSDIELRQSRANRYPSLNAFSTQGFNYGRTVDRFTNEFATERVLSHNMYASGELVLFAGFQQMNHVRYQLLNHTAVRYDTEALKNEVLLSIAASYLQVLYTRDMLDVARQQLEVMEQQLARSRVLFEGGTLSRAALLDMEAQASAESLNVLQAENNVKLATLDLMHLLDLDPLQEFEVERPALDEHEHLPLYASTEVMRLAMQSEPSVLAARQRIGMAEKSLAIYRGALSPRLSLSASMGTGYSEAAMQLVDVTETGNLNLIGFTESQERVYAPERIANYAKKPYRDQLRDNYNTQLGLSLNIPVFNRLQARNRVSHARIDLEQARVSYELQKNNLNKIIEQAHADAVAARQRYEATGKSREAFAEAFHYMEQRFNLGMASPVEFNESKARLARAETDSIQALYEYVFKAAILSFYRGEGFGI